MNNNARHAAVRGERSRVVIAGCGRTGAAIAEALSLHGIRVRIIDLAPEAFNRLPARMVERGQISPVLGDVTLESNLRRAVDQDSVTFIAMTSSDTVNIMAAQIAYHTMMIPTVICRIDDPVKRDLYERLELTALSHTNTMTELVTNLIK